MITKNYKDVIKWSWSSGQLARFLLTQYEFECR